MSGRLLGAALLTVLLSAGAALGAAWWVERADSALPQVVGARGNPVGGAPRTTVARDGESAYTSTVASATVPLVQVYDDPSDVTPRHVLEHPQESGAPLVFLVTERRGDWIQALLPVRPNGSRGWIKAGDVELSRHDYRIVVKLSSYEITVYHRDGIFHREEIAVGRGETPTPVGVFYTKELVQPPDPDTAYGVYVYGLSGFSNVLFEFAGGEGVVGIHGTNDPSVLGTDVSYGCIRMSNEGITKLANHLPLGVPVVIEP